MLERSSPGKYCRYSANSTLKPLNGLRCRPDRNPSTMVRAFRSSVLRRAMTAGSRNRSSPGRTWVAMGLQTALRYGNLLEQARDDAVGVDAFGFRVEVRHDAVPENRLRECMDVLHRYVMPPMHQ